MTLQYNLHTEQNPTFFYFSGRPKPMVRWLWSGHPIRETSEVSSGSTVTSTVILRDLQREDNGALLTCLAKNNNVSTPVKHSVALLMNCKYFWRENSKSVSGCKLKIARSLRISLITKYAE